jgi:hypothetical protein
MVGVLHKSSKCIYAYTYACYLTHTLGGGGVRDITYTVIREQIKRALYVQRILFVLKVFEIIKENCPKIP